LACHLKNHRDKNGKVLVPHDAIFILRILRRIFSQTEKRVVSRIWKNGTHFLIRGRYLVEAEGIEPSSRDKTIGTSTYLVYILNSSFLPPVDEMKERLAALEYSLCFPSAWKQN